MRWMRSGWNFNTKKVRLKRPGCDPTAPGWYAFQYQKGAIKTLRPSWSKMPQRPYFNTKKVRLKLEKVQVSRPSMRNFNTKKVRLKRARASQGRWSKTRHFNTKKVRLKPGQRGRGWRPYRPFQYQKGAIKTRVVASTTIAEIPFQYQKGAIKTRRFQTSGWSGSYFNTKKVRLKQEEACRPFAGVEISIPKRCD